MSARGPATALAFAALACAAPRSVLVPTPAELEARGCVRVGDVQGVGSGGWGTTRDQQVYWARRDAQTVAESIGATDVGYVGESGDQNRLVLEGVAYRCP